MASAIAAGRFIAGTAVGHAFPDGTVGGRLAESHPEPRTRVARLG
jgi:hypothetical protein